MGGFRWGVVGSFDCMAFIAWRRPHKARRNEDCQRDMVCPTFRLGELSYNVVNY